MFKMSNTFGIIKKEILNKPSIDIQIRDYLKFKKNIPVGMGKVLLRIELRKLEAGFINEMPDKYPIDGVVLKKMATGGVRYIAVYSEESFLHSRGYSASAPRKFFGK